MVTGVSEGFAPNLSSKASASGFSSSSIQTWGTRLRAATSLRRAASLEWREPIILRPRPVLIMYVRLARKAFRMTSERLGSSVTISFSRSRGMASKEDPYRPCLAREVVDHLHLALKDDYEVVLGVACPKQDIPDLRLPLLPVAPEDVDLVFPKRRGPRTADLIHSIIHVATSSIALTTIASIMPPTAGASSQSDMFPLLARGCWLLRIDRARPPWSLCVDPLRRIPPTFDRRHLDHLDLENVRPDGEVRHLCYAFQDSRTRKGLPKGP